ncbi:MAG: hypothetical protein PGN12_17065 [Sphingomonas phyllosphaerae]
MHWTPRTSIVTRRAAVAAIPRRRTLPSPTIAYRPVCEPGVRGSSVMRSYRPASRMPTRVPAATPIPAWSFLPSSISGSPRGRKPIGANTHWRTTIRSGDLYPVSATSKLAGTSAGRLTPPLHSSHAVRRAVREQAEVRHPRRQIQAPAPAIAERDRLASRSGQRLEQDLAGAVARDDHALVAGRVLIDRDHRAVADDSRDRRGRG